jgi:FMN reductase
MTVVGVVVGNPRPKSRTLDVALTVGRAIDTSLGKAQGQLDPVVDLADLAPLVFDYASQSVRDAVEAARSCDVLVVASPTYKATYTGLLKAFLDWFGATDLDGVVAVPVMVGAGAAHALAVEVHLRPLLVEIGATVPTRGLYVLESDLATLDDVVAAWMQFAEPALRRAMAGPPPAT